MVTPTPTANVTFVRRDTGVLIVRRAQVAREPELVRVTASVPLVYLAMAHVLATSTKRRHGCYQSIFHDIQGIVKIVRRRTVTRERAMNVRPTFGVMAVGGVTIRI